MVKYGDLLKIETPLCIGKLATVWCHIFTSKGVQRLVIGTKFFWKAILIETPNVNQLFYQLQRDCIIVLVEDYSRHTMSNFETVGWPDRAKWQCMHGILLCEWLHVAHKQTKPVRTLSSWMKIEAFYVWRILKESTVSSQKQRMPRQTLCHFMPSVYGMGRFICHSDFPTALFWPLQNRKS